MLCSVCSTSSDGSARYCTCCGRSLVANAPYPEGPLGRTRSGRMIAGVCAGFAQAYRLDVTLTRLIVCALALFTSGTVVVAYLVAWVIMPEASYVVPSPNGGMVAS